MGKKGSGHLEVIISFTMFLFILLFILVYIRPLETNKISEVAVISLKQEFSKINDIESIRVFAKSEDESRCVPNQNISETLLSLNSTYRNVSQSDNTFYILFSSDFSGQLGNCSTGQNISLGSTSRRTALSNKTLTKMQQKYSSNYSGLRQDLKIPEVLNFEIIGGEFNMVMEKPEGIDVFAKSYMLPVLYQDGEQVNKEFTFLIW